MDPRIENLKSTTFLGKRLTRRQIADIQDAVGRFPALSRRELGHTICEHLGWYTPTGRYRIQSGLRMLEQLEKPGILSLSRKRAISKPLNSFRKSDWALRTEVQPAIEGDLQSLLPLTLQEVTEPGAVGEWNAWIDRYHYLGYRRPFGSHLRYFIVDRHGRKLGGLLFEAATTTLPDRDQWVGWSQRARVQRLNRVVNNSRFLIFPWVQVKFLASRSLSMAVRQLADDWEARHGLRPVLVETFVDLTKFEATSYRAANWQKIGMTKGRKVGVSIPK